MKAWGVDCSVANPSLNTQEKVDNFQATYGGGGVCDRVTGTLTVTGPDITNLDGLADLTSVEEILAAYGGDVAAVIVEPVAGNMGTVLPVASLIFPI